MRQTQDKYTTNSSPVTNQKSYEDCASKSNLYLMDLNVWHPWSNSFHWSNNNVHRAIYMCTGLFLYAQKQPGLFLEIAWSISRNSPGYFCAQGYFIFIRPLDFTTFHAQLYTFKGVLPQPNISSQGSTPPTKFFDGGSGL